MTTRGRTLIVLSLTAMAIGGTVYVATSDTQEAGPLECDSEFVSTASALLDASTPLPGEAINSPAEVLSRFIDSQGEDVAGRLRSADVVPLSVDRPNIQQRLMFRHEGKRIAIIDIHLAGRKWALAGAAWCPSAGR